MNSPRDLLKSLANDLIDTLDPRSYLERIGLEPYSWQVCALDAIKAGETRLFLLGARQVGKSTITAGIPAWVSKNEKALTLIYAPSDEQSKDDIERIKAYITGDPAYPDLLLDSADHIKLPNGSYIKANTATAKTKRGKSMPRLILFDEAAHIEDILYRTVRPMLTKNPNCILIQLSTPNGRKGFFFRSSKSDRYFRIMVKAPWDIIDGEIVPAEPERKFQKRMAEQGIHGFYSPRHTDYDFMVEELEENGEQWFRQEYLCEFVEPEDQVFSYDDIEAAFNSQAKPLPMGEIGIAEGLEGLD